MTNQCNHEWQIERGSHALFGVGRTVWCECGESMNVEDLLNAWQTAEQRIAELEAELDWMTDAEYTAIDGFERVMGVEFATP
jgi:hypothetical protein